ncbi:hypothetical protein Cgig2_005807 [Carnegiea gigantea]|uniref:Uncharacterized protein n=1 Tax=Carnegiea gigantea TaxID=171969 RepID=A0A9Q1KJT6_9CARY|nr:hypothetical protein Cgig2_005807 [Carnegiea gigantea]
MDGSYGSQRASLKNGDESTNDLIYRRSSSLKTLTIFCTLNSKVTWVRKEKVGKGTRSYSYNHEKSCIKVCKGYTNFFNPIVLEKVNMDSNRDEKFLVTPSFYPAFHKLLILKRNWDVDFRFRELSSFMIGAIEWTEYILKHFEYTLRSANTCRVVGLSYYPYHYHFDRDVWRAFCELGSPTTNTLHHDVGGVGISLYNLERIGGLPILGGICKDFYVNEDLMDDEKFSPIVLELLHIHAELWRFHKSSHIYWNFWLHHFYRGELIWGAFGKESEQRTSSVPLNKVRDFRNGLFNGKRSKISLAPIMLGYIYHALYSQPPNSEYLANYPTLMHYARMSTK